MCTFVPVLGCMLLEAGYLLLVRMAMFQHMRVSGCVVTHLLALTLVSVTWCSSTLLVFLTHLTLLIHLTVTHLALPHTSHSSQILFQIHPTLHSSDTMMWEKCPDFAPNEQGAPLSCPTPRAGACAAVVGTRMYLWSGRDGYKKIWNQQVSVGDA